MSVRVTSNWNILISALYIHTPLKWTHVQKCRATICNTYICVVYTYIYIYIYIYFFFKLMLCTFEHVSTYLLLRVDMTVRNVSNLRAVTGKK